MSDAAGQAQAPGGLQGAGSGSMKGSEVARRFFCEWGLPFVRAEFPELAERIAAGLSGGSDAIGADDEWSRDHDWGPRFELWLTSDDYRRCGRRLERRLNLAAPETFLGVRYHFYGERKDPVRVESTDRFFEWFGWRCPPRDPKDWFRRRGRDALVDKEAWLYFAVHGPIFYDPLGEFSARRQAFAHYPRDVRLKLMAELCLSIWGLGEYKFCQRHVHRQDPMAIGICLGHFAHKVMRLCFLLNDDYAPHETWIHHEFKKLPEAAALDEQLVQLMTSRDLEEQRGIILDVGRYVRGRLLAEGLVDSDQPGYGLRCREVEARIEDPTMRRM